MNRKREPRLVTSVHETEHRINPAMIQMQTLPLSWFKHQSLLFTIFSNCLTYTRLNTSEQTDQSVGNSIAIHEILGNLFFANPTRREISHRPVHSPGFIARSFFDQSGRSFHILAEILQKHFHSVKEVHQTGCVG